MRYQLKKYKLIFIPLFLFILCSNIFAQQGWYNTNLSFGGGAVYFKDINNGIIDGYKTTNAGFTWNYVGFGGSMSFPDPNIGYSTGGSFIFKTTNFGDNYIMQSNPSNRILNSINFKNVNTGFACGDDGSLIKTTNGGNNWLSVNTPVTTNFYVFTNVFFIDAVTGYLAGYRATGDTSVFLKTTNSGSSWSPQFFPVISWGRFSSMFFVNANTGYIGAASNGNILKTTNGGSGWNQVMIPTVNIIKSIHFPSASTGYASCYGGQILKTINGGSNWFLQTTGTGNTLFSIFFINNLTGYSAGRDASGNNGSVIKTTDGGGPPIGITPISNEVPKDFRLEQNYPNPFNPNTKIKFQIAKLSNARLIIFDALGREVVTLVNEELKPGTYEVNFDGTKLSSGIYFYRIQAGNFIDIKKMVLIK